MKLVVLFTLLVLLLVGCASPTTYEKASNKRDYGYSQTKLTSNQYRITFRGNRITDKETVKDYALLRAADLTIEQGHDWFLVISQDSETEKRKVTQTSPAIRTGTTVYRSCGALGCRTVVTPHYIGGFVTTTEEDGAYVSSIEITMGSGTPEDRNRVYDAKELAKNIRAQIK
ncbi:CC0125/CC1285 family lipoprotein [Flocculibacter collagenilyticus]|uniref:CC0125/CC1285 family lipoprotein n=1 Tax=Flocculibacter collagenilyticus TaxID=2744479 RepID=UPI0018F63911|nr:hypothetical protein [Flocculibacter collagenilyticus]